MIRKIKVQGGSAKYTRYLVTLVYH